MNVAELMPRHPSQARRLRRRLQHVPQQLGLAQGIALPIAEHEILWRPPTNALSMRRESRHYMGTERYRSHGPLRLGGLDVPLEDGLAHH